MEQSLISLEAVRKAAENIADLVQASPLQNSVRYSERFKAHVWLKREDLQTVRSFKIRGAYHKIKSLSESERKKGVVCSSAGNHAQGVALACASLGIQGTIYMPSPTPRQKVDQVAMFGGNFVKIVLTGDTYDDAYKAAMANCEEHQSVFVHPFDDKTVITGQATMALEIIDQVTEPLDYIFVPIGGGGLVSGVINVFKQCSPSTKIIGVEPEGAPAMHASLKQGKIVVLDEIDRFVDGAAVKQVGKLSYEYCKQYLDDLILVHEGAICQTILDMYNRDAIVVEPAGAMATTALEAYADKIIGKNVACLICGSNNDITRMAEIKERALLAAGLKHYFIVRFPQRAGALKEFVAEILGPNDDITFFEYSKKSSRSQGPAVVGIELKNAQDLNPLIERMKAKNFFGDYLNNKPDLFQFLV